MEQWMQMGRKIRDLVNPSAVGQRLLILDAIKNDLCIIWSPPGVVGRRLERSVKAADGEGLKGVL